MVDGIDLLMLVAQQQEGGMGMAEGGGGPVSEWGVHWHLMDAVAGHHYNHIAAAAGAAAEAAEAAGADAAAVGEAGAAAGVAAAVAGGGAVGGGAAAASSLRQVCMSFHRKGGDVEPGDL